jgi:hypothetical protein
MIAAEIAHVLGDVRREGRGWRCRCPLHGGRSLILRQGDGGRVLVWCFGGCNSHDVLDELRRRRLLDGKTQPRDTITKAPPHENDERKIARAAQATVEAIMVAVRERGLAALKDAANVERLARCDQAARAQINRRIARLIEHKGS